MVSDTLEAFNHKFLSFYFSATQRYDDVGDLGKPSRSNLIPSHKLLMKGKPNTLVLGTRLITRWLNSKRRVTWSCTLVGKPNCHAQWVKDGRGQAEGSYSKIFSKLFLYSSIDLKNLKLYRFTILVFFLYTLSLSDSYTD